MKITEILISNIKGIDSLKIAVGSLTIVKGANGSGKSSIIDAIASVFEGGHDPGLVRQGAKSGKVTLTLEDGTTITKTVTAKASTLEIKTRDGVIVPKPQSFVERLASGFAFDPIALLTAKPKERAAFLLSVMPVRFERDEITEAIGDYCGGALELDGLAAYREKLYDERTGINRAVKQHEGTVATMEASLPAGTAENKAAEIAELEAALSSKQLQLAQLNTSEASRIADMKAEIKERMEAEIELLRSAALAAMQSKEQEIRSDFESERVIISEVASCDRTALDTARAEQTQIERAQAARELIGKLNEQIRAGNLRELKLSANIKAIDDLKARKLAEMPIPGVEAREGDLFVDGIPFDHVNTARRFSVAFQLASLAAGELPLMIADDAEHLVGSDWAEFQEAAKGSGFQIICARAEEGALKIEAA